MTGPEHYLAAEQLVAQARCEVAEIANCLIAAAHVHATLALAAATALNVPGGEDAGMYVADLEGWEQAASAHVRPGPDPNPLAFAVGA